MPLIRYALLLTLCCLFAAADTVANLEVKLNADPNNIQLRADLMDAYAEAGNAGGYVQQVFWFVENHPESTLLHARGNMAERGGRFNTPADFEQVRAAWEVQLNLHADSGAVLLNAALFLRASDPLRAVELLEQARKTTPEESRKTGAVSSSPPNASREFPFCVAASSRALCAPEESRKTGAVSSSPPNASREFPFCVAASSRALCAPSATYIPEARIFVTAFTGAFPKDTSDTLKSRLLASSDPELLGDTGSFLSNSGGAENIATGIELIKMAVSLDPTNTAWQKMLQQAQAVASLQVPSAGPVRVGSKVAEANLISKVDPVYPALAKSAFVEGTVEFTATIDENGSVQNLQLLRGHPLLVTAAKEAVKQWKYRPTLLNGKPVAVLTTLDVQFSQ